jgi:hypothetical protein
MDDTCQIDLPPSFLALHMRPGRTSPDRPWAEIYERYELCEAMATMLFDMSSRMVHELRIAEKDALERCYCGLIQKDQPFTSQEAIWIGYRLAELLGQTDSVFMSIADSKCKSSSETESELDSARSN